MKFLLEIIWYHQFRIWEARRRRKIDQEKRKDPGKRIKRGERKKGVIKGGKNGRTKNIGHHPRNHLIQTLVVVLPRLNQDANRMIKNIRKKKIKVLRKKLQVYHLTSINLLPNPHFLLLANLEWLLLLLRIQKLRLQLQPLLRQK